MKELETLMNQLPGWAIQLFGMMEGKKESAENRRFQSAMEDKRLAGEERLIEKKSDLEKVAVPQKWIDLGLTTKKKVSPSEYTTLEKQFYNQEEVDVPGFLEQYAGKDKIMTREELTNAMSLYQIDKQAEDPKWDYQLGMDKEFGQVLKYWNEYDKNIMDPQGTYNLIEPGEGGKGIKFTPDFDKYYDPITRENFLNDYETQYGNIDSQYLGGIQEALDKQMGGGRENQMEELYRHLMYEAGQERKGVTVLGMSDYLLGKGYGDLSERVSKMTAPGTPLDELGIGTAIDDSGGILNENKNKLTFEQIIGLNPIETMQKINPDMFKTGAVDPNSVGAKFWEALMNQNSNYGGYGMPRSK